MSQNIYTYNPTDGLQQIGDKKTEVKSGTLAAGATSITLTFTTETIGTNTLIDIHTDVLA